MEPEEIYAEALEGNRIEDADDTHCYSAPCITNGDCCRGLMCLETGKLIFLSIFLNLEPSPTLPTRMMI